MASCKRKRESIGDHAPRMGLVRFLSRLTTLAVDGKDGSSSASRCPVQHAQQPPVAAKADQSTSGCPVLKHDASSKADQSASASGCPVLQRSSGGCGSDSLELNPLNRMPLNPAQQRADGQSVELPKDRVMSTIPKGDGSGTWEYPSPQMFYNALVKKGKGGGVEEQDMEAVVAIHNNMNEGTWKQVLQWEDMHCDTCSAPRKLVRFLGRPDELSPKAALKYYLGLAPRPFDRHDWTVDRCGTEVRYIIDYYDVAEKRSEDRVPAQMNEEGAVPSIYCDVRPAGDTPSQLFDRLRMLLPSAASTEPSEAPPTNSDALPKSADTPARAAEGKAREASAVNAACADRIAALQACQSDQECAQAHIGLMLCIAQRVCAEEAAAFSALGGSGSSASAAEAGERFSRMEACVSKWAAAQGGAPSEEPTGCPVR